MIDPKATALCSACGERVPLPDLVDHVRGHGEHGTARELVEGLHAAAKRLSKDGIPR